MADIWMDVDAALSEVPVNLLPLIDDTDFKSREESVVYNQAGLDLLWNFTTTAGAFTQTAVTPTDTAGDYDWVNQGNGHYTIGMPASGGASANNDSEGFGYFSGFATGILPWRSPVYGFRAAGLNNALIDSAYSATRGLTGTAVPAAAADAAGGLPISDAGGLDLDTQLAATNEVTAARMAALTDWINGGRLDLLLDAIPTTPMRGTDSALLAANIDLTGGAVDTVTTLTNKTGFSLAATGLDAIGQAATGMVEIAKAVWDRVLTGATHNIASSAGRRLRQIQESGAVYNGQVWVDTNNGVAGTTPYENGTSDNHVDLWASAIAIAPNVNGGLANFHILNGSSIDFTGAAVDNYSLFGNNYMLALGGVSCVDLYVEGAMVSGIGLAASGDMHFEGSEISTVSVQSGHFDFCSFNDVVTQTLAGDYNYHDCYSGVAGAGAPTFTKTAGQTITAQFRRWSGGIIVSGLEAGDVVTISGELGTVTLNGADATVEIRGSYKAIVNNLTGAPTVNMDGAWKGVDIADTLVDTADIQTRLPAALASGRMSSDAEAISGSTTAADNLEEHAEAVIPGAAETGTLSTTQATTDLTGYANDELIGRAIIFKSGTANGQASDITAYASAGGLVTFTAIPTAPANGDLFIIT